MRINLLAKDRRLQSVLLLMAAVVIATLALFQAGSQVLAQSKSLVWQQFDVDIDVAPDGTFEVTEHQTIDFTNGSFSFGYREIPIRNLAHIDGWSLSDSDGNIYQQTANTAAAPHTFSVEKSGGAYLINWHFPPLANATKTYHLQYTVHEGLRYYDTGDQLWWKAIYGERDFPVLAGTVQVQLPAAAEIMVWDAYVNDLSAPERFNVEVANDQSLFKVMLTQRLAAGEEVEIRVQFTPNVVAGSAPAWQAAADELAAQREAELLYRQRWGPWASLLLGGLGLLFFVGGPALLYLLWYRVGRDQPTEVIADYLPEPPDELPPALVGTLIDEHVDMHDLLATIVDLAQRKVISITEEQSEGFFRMGNDFVYRWEDQQAELLPYERQLLESMFGRKDEVRLSDLKNKFYTKLPKLQQSLYQAVAKSELFPSNPDHVRNRYRGFAMAGLAVAALLGVVLVNLFGDLTAVAVFPAIGIGFTALGLLFLARWMPRKTAHGVAVSARWLAFKRYLQNIDTYADMAEQKAIWDRWLPYAIAFGIDKEYIRKFEAVDAPAPGWYIPSPTLYGPYRRRYYGPYGGQPTTTTPGRAPTGGSGDGSLGGGLSDASRGMGASLASMSAGLGTLLTSASSTMTSRPASSSSGSGGSFSGGGSFGGGGGGGGSGGFG